MVNTSLAHHGILGMKWGVRRFQKEDGSLTPKGKARAKESDSMSDDELASKVKRMNLESQYDKLNKENAPAPQKSNVEKIKKVVDAASGITKQAKTIATPASKPERIDLDKMTDSELREKVNRFNLEKQYKEIVNTTSPQTMTKGQQYVNQALDIAGTVLTVTSSAIGLAMAIKELKGS
jgi:hypothetical protein